MLSAHHLHKSYNIHSILFDVSFNINPSERVGLIGPNGCGKTTLLRILAGVETPEQGLVTRVPPDLQIGYLPQGFKANPGHTVAETIRGVTGEPQAAEELIQKACQPFDNHQLRDTLIEIQRRNEQVIDIESQDQLLQAGFSSDEAQQKIETFQRFIEENKDEITALQILYSQPYGARKLTYQAVKELAEAIERPPYNLTPEALWRAYERLDQSRVRAAGPSRLLTDLIALVRYALEQSETLEPFPLTVEERYKNWMIDQQEAGREFNAEQLAWLEMIKNHIAASVTIEMDDFEQVPFNHKGGAVKVYELFGAELDGILEELSQVLVG